MYITESSGFLPSCLSILGSTFNLESTGLNYLKSCFWNVLEEGLCLLSHTQIQLSMSQTKIDDQDLSHVKYNGTWIRGGSPSEFDGTVASSTRVGDSFTVSFTG